mgnify:CR=1 FL=1
MNQETAIVEQINNLRNLKLSLEKEQRNLAETRCSWEAEHCFAISSLSDLHMGEL